MSCYRLFSVMATLCVKNWTTMTDILNLVQLEAINTLALYIRKLGEYGNIRKEYMLISFLIAKQQNMR